MYEFEDIVSAVTGWFHNTRGKEAFIKSENLITYHSSLGKEIRNEFKLWETEWKPDLVNGIDTSEDHPDQVSMRVIKEVQRRLKEKENV